MNIEWDIEELACKVLGKNEDETSQIINDSETDDLLFEEYGVDFETYCKIVKGLLPFTPKQTAMFSDKKYHAFVEESTMVVKVLAP